MHMPDLKEAKLAVERFSSLISSLSKLLQQKLEKETDDDDYKPLASNLERWIEHSSILTVIVFKKLDPLMERLAADRLHELEALLIAMAALHDLQLQGKNLLAECNEGRINKQESTEMTIFEILP